MARTLVLVLTCTLAAGHAGWASANSSRTQESNAEVGDPIGQTDLGLALIEGRSRRRDAPAGIAWLLKAAEQGHPLAQRLMGDILSTGKLVPKDDAAALRWYQRAAAGGDADAQAELGSRYTQGWGVETNDALAVMWEEKGAAAGSVEASTYLGARYATGRGVPQDLAKAVVHYRRAAEGGSAVGMCLVGYMTQRGEGTEPNPQEAYRWYFAAFAATPAPRLLRPIEMRLVGSRRVACERFLKETRNQLTPDARAAAEREARQWLSSHPPVALP